MEHDLTATRTSGSPTSLPAVPTSFGSGRYVVVRFIGRGGQKDVYLGRDTRLDRDVAIALTHHTIGPTAMIELRREAQAMARLSNNPHVVSIYDIGEEQGQTFIVSQYVDGGSVAEWLKTKQQPLPTPTIIAMGTSVARALVEAHSCGIVHRDVKPGNIWMLGNHAFRLGDFGLASGTEPSLTRAERILRGTPAYMAPELFSNQPATPASDMYAIGVSLYQAATGALPFRGDQAFGIIWQHLHVQPVAPSWLNRDVPAALEQIILRLMAKDPDARMTALELADMLDRVALQSDQGLSSAVTGDARMLARLAPGVFVGRQRELSSLQHALDEIPHTGGRLMFIAGEAGSGKTRLVEQLTVYAKLTGALVVSGSCDEASVAPPFWPWVQIIRSILSTLDPAEQRRLLGGFAGPISTFVPEVRDIMADASEPPQLEPEQARFRLFDSVMGVLRLLSRARPLLIVLDDLQWADRPSLMLLQFVARDMRQLPILIVATMRDATSAQHAPMPEFLSTMAIHGLADRQTLRGLSEDEIRSFIELTASVAPTESLVTTIHERTGGNPFFVNEIVRLLVGNGSLQQSGDADVHAIEIPGRVREVLQQRLRALSEDCRRALTVASVLGREFDFDTLQAASEISSSQLLDAIDEAVAAGLIVESQAGSLFFAHALVRETLYETLTQTRRANLHERIAKLFEQRHAERIEEASAELAHHFGCAVGRGAVEKTVLYSTMAANRAAQLLAYEQAVSYFDRALTAHDTLSTLDSGTRCDLLIRLGEAQMRAGDSAAGLATFQKAVGSARTRGAGEQLARAALGMCGSAFMGAGISRVDQSQSQLIEEALRSEQIVGTPLQAELLAQLSLMLYHSEDRRVHFSDQAVAAARSAGSTTALVRALYSRCVCLEGFDTSDERVALVEQVLEIADAAGDREMTLRGRFRQFREYLERGDFDAADAALDRCSAIAAELKQPRHQWLVSFAHSTKAVIQGRFSDAENLLKQAVAIGKRVDDPTASLFSNMQTLMIRKLQGRYEELAAHNREMIERYRIIPAWRASVAQTCVKLGRLDEAKVYFDFFVDSDFSALPRDGAWTVGMANLAEVCAALGDVTQARRLYDLMAPFGDRNIVIGSSASFFGPMAHYLGVLATAMSSWDAAAAHYEAAHVAAAPCPPFAARTQLEFARLMLQRDRTNNWSRAQAMLRDATRIADEIGMLRVGHDARELITRFANVPPSG